MEGQNAGVETEEGVPAQHFDVSILEEEGVMGRYCCRVDGGLVVRSVYHREVGQSGNANGRRVSDGGFVKFWFPGGEYGWRREALPATLP